MTIQNSFTRKVWGQTSTTDDLGLGEARGDLDTHGEETDGRQRRRITFGTKDSDIEYERFMFCDMLVVVDAATFQGVYDSDVWRTQFHVLQVHTDSSDIFKATNFGEYSGTTYKVVRIKIMTEFEENEISGTDLWNLPAQDDVYEITNEFAFNLGDSPDHMAYCLVHLTTMKTFDLGTLGAAFRPKGDLVIGEEGICGKWHETLGGGASNVGFSSLYFEFEPMSYYKHMTTVAHEIGHQWGARHDPDPRDLAGESECAPGELMGGLYLMAAAAPDGSEANNCKFSPCSRRDIESILKITVHWCFLSNEVAQQSYCGNGILEAGEECDEHHLPIGDQANEITGPEKNLTCCTEKCRLAENAYCSNLVSPCCNAMCNASSNTTECYTEFSFDNDCSSRSYCDGINWDSCPQPGVAHDGKKCLKDGHVGQCKAGTCQTACVALGGRRSPPQQLENCHCTDSRDTMCTLCCRDLGSQDRRCKPTEESIEEGAACYLGICRDGKCVTSETVMLRRSVSHRSYGLAIFLTSLAVSVFVIIVRWRKAIANSTALDVVSKGLNRKDTARERLLGEKRSRTRSLRAMSSHIFGRSLAGGAAGAWDGMSFSQKYAAGVRAACGRIGCRRKKRRETVHEDTNVHTQMQFLDTPSSMPASAKPASPEPPRPKPHKRKKESHTLHFASQE